MRMRTLAVVTFSALAGVALAQGGGNPTTSPGWVYSMYNCGPASGGTSSSGCRQCCRAAVFGGQLDPTELQNCYAFCNQANWQPLYRSPWWAVPILKIFGPR